MIANAYISDVFGCSLVWSFGMQIERVNILSKHHHCVHLSSQLCEQ